MTVGAHPALGTHSVETKLRGALIVASNFSRAALPDGISGLAQARRARRYALCWRPEPILRWVMRRLSVRVSPRLRLGVRSYHDARRTGKVVRILFLRIVIGDL